MLAPAICLIAVNAISLLRSSFSLFALATAILRQPGHSQNILLLFPYFGTTFALSVIAVLGGVFMLVQRHQRFCFGAVVISMVVGILGGPLLLLNLPVAIWSLHALQRTDLAAAIQTPATAPPARLVMQPLRVIALGTIFVLGVIAACGYSFMIAFGISMSGAGAGSTGYNGWTFQRLLSCLPAVSFLLVSLACLPFFGFRAFKFVAVLSLLLLTPFLIFAALSRGGVFVPIAGEALLSTGAAFFI